MSLVMVLTMTIFLIACESPASSNSGSGSETAVTSVLPEEAQKLNSHLGLRNMRERARYLGGTLKITTAPEEGTEIQLVVPMISAK